MDNGNFAPKLIYETLATLEYPEGHEAGNNKFERWSSCMNTDQDKLYVLFSNHKFAWIYCFRYKADNSFVQDGKPSLVTQHHAKAVYFLNK